MCGRYVRRADKQKIAEVFRVKTNLDDIDFVPDDDITPGTMQPVVYSNDEGDRVIDLMYWGFTFPKRLTFNTRAESILQRSLSKNSFEQRRCILPADYFFEWKCIQKKNNPKYRVSICDREPFALAGIWSMWKDKFGHLLPTVSVIASEPNEAMEEVHDRQPVILETRDYAVWLGVSDRHRCTYFACSQLTRWILDSSTDTVCSSRSTALNEQHAQRCGARLVDSHDEAEIDSRADDGRFLTLGHAGPGLGGGPDCAKQRGLGPRRTYASLQLPIHVVDGRRAELLVTK